MWFLNQLQPDSAAYNVPLGVRLNGPLDAVALERSLKEVVRRHEVLRTTFPVVADGPVQRIDPVPARMLSLFDLTDLAEQDQEEEISRRLAEEARRPFDLIEGPLLRALLLRLDEKRHVLAVTMHRIASDGWSIGVLLRELSALYDAFAAGQPSPLPELPLQYGDYANWQWEQLRSETFERSLAYWKQRLQGAPALLGLPTDFRRPAVLSSRGSGCALALEAGLARALRELSRREGVTLFMTMLAAFKVLLARLSGQEDVVVSSPIAGRDRTELEALIGFFANTLVLRTDLSGNLTFRELLRPGSRDEPGRLCAQSLPF